MFAYCGWVVEFLNHLTAKTKSNISPSKLKRAVVDLPQFGCCVLLLRGGPQEANLQEVLLPQGSP